MEEEEPNLGEMPEGLDEVFGPEDGTLTITVSTLEWMCWKYEIIKDKQNECSVRYGVPSHLIN